MIHRVGWLYTGWGTYPQYCMISRGQWMGLNRDVSFFKEAAYRYIKVIITLVFTF